MTTYRKYNPEKDVLKPGTRIRLAGREGAYDGSMDPIDYKAGHRVNWLDSTQYSYLDLQQFPFLEIAEEPLRISKRLKEELREQISAAVLDTTGDSWIGDTIEDRLITFLNSLEEME